MAIWFRRLGHALVGALRASLLNQASRVAAGLAYYMSFSIAPILTSLKYFRADFEAHLKAAL